MTATLDDDLSLIDRFCDALWLEDGLSRNTIDAYRRDLAMLARWLHESETCALLTVDDAALSGYFSASSPSRILRDDGVTKRGWRRISL